MIKRIIIGMILLIGLTGCAAGLFHGNRTVVGISLNIQNYGLTLGYEKDEMFLASDKQSGKTKTTTTTSPTGEISIKQEGEYNNAPRDN